MKPRGALLVLLLLLSACEAHVSGLLPVFPSPRNGDVDSLRPTLKWEAFMPPKGSEITDVVYDLKVMQAYGGWLVYSKEGLPQPEHRLEKALEPDSRYTWSVRVRFRSHGERRLSQWTTLSNEKARESLTPASAGEFLPLRTPARGAPNDE